MGVRIVIDSTTDVTPVVRQRVTTVPLTITFGSEEYTHGVNLTNNEFYEKLVTSDVLPTTSQPAPAVFEEVYREITGEGDDVVVLTVASKLSGTYQSATIAAEDFPGRVFVVDTKTVAIGAGILTEYALTLVDEGLSAGEIAGRLSEERENVRLFAMLDTLEYLKKGGRISKTVAFAGGLLSIKPIVTIADGEISVIGKARGTKQGNALLLKESQPADFTRPVLLGYTGSSDALLQKFITDSGTFWPAATPITLVGSVVGTHAGPGAVAVAFFA